MTDLLLITDVARLRKIFSRLADDKSIRLRVVNNLEKGGEEIALEKPSCVFVQTHLSGLSADIILMHLKKRLGRKRTRFVLIAAPDQVNDAILKPFHGWLDTSQDDAGLLSALKAVIKPPSAARGKQAETPSPQPPEPVMAAAPADAAVSPQPADAIPPSEQTAMTVSATAEPPPPLQIPAVPAAESSASLEERGITYSGRSKLSVYSEFNSSFDSAVNAAPEPEPVHESAALHEPHWADEAIETADISPSRSKRATFLLWLIPVVVIVVIVTIMQQRRTPAPKVAVAPPPPAATAQPPKAAIPGGQPAQAPVAAPQAAAQPQAMSDKAVISELAGNAPVRNDQKQSAASGRPKTLPDFIPRYGYDKEYSAANPGWERYKGQVTEFKVFREQGSIKAIQVIDRGGNGVPESFMKAVMHQLVKNPVFAVEASEKKEGYEVQRGQAAAGLKVVYYRDEQGGRLRAFVMTWQ